MALLKAYFSLSGRLSLKEYWGYWNIPFLVALLIEYYLSKQGHPLNTSIISAINILIIWPVVATTVKRLHDIDKSGWFVLIHLIPFLGTAILFVLTSFVPGTKGKNRFGQVELVKNNI
jgi:uncharacterized membrane protein YhaH (DUF805 family)